MKNIAPDIFRQRLIIEGYYRIEVSKGVIEKYLLELAAHLGLRTYGQPIVFSPASGMGKEENAGFDAFVQRSVAALPVERAAVDHVSPAQRGEPR